MSMRLHQLCPLGTISSCNPYLRGKSIASDGMQRVIPRNLSSASLNFLRSGSLSIAAFAIASFKGTPCSRYFFAAGESLSINSKFAPKKTRYRIITGVSRIEELDLLPITKWTFWIKSTIWFFRSHKKQPATGNQYGKATHRLISFLFLPGIDAASGTAMPISP